MKKFISIALSAVMLISAGAISAMPVMAASVASPGSSEVTTKPASETQPVLITVNSNSSKKISYTKNDSQYTFSYKGKGDVVKWEFPGLVEGVDYQIVSTSADNSSIVIELTESGKQKQIAANAVVKGEGSDTDDDSIDDEDDSKDDSTKKDKGNTSPATGAAMAGIAMAGAGVAMLAVSKKKKD